MAFQFSTTFRNAALDQIETVVGTAPKVQVRSGAAPANCAAADAGTLLLEFDCPSDWLNAASGGSKTKLGTWAGTGHANAGGGTNAGHFRIKDSSGTTCHIQGTVTITSGGGDMTLDNINIAQNQPVTITSFTLNAGGA